MQAVPCLGAPALVRSASCTFQGSGPKIGWPNGEVWKGKPPLCCVKKLDGGGCAGGMPNQENKAPAMFAPN